MRPFCCPHQTRAGGHISPWSVRVFWMVAWDAACFVTESENQVGNKVGNKTKPLLKGALFQCLIRQYGGEGGIASAHPWASPSLCSDRCAVQIGYPADLSNPIPSGYGFSPTHRNERPRISGALHSWRRGWDSNPRGALTPAGFQDQCIQPLCHLSINPCVWCDPVKKQRKDPRLGRSAEYRTRHRFANPCTGEGDLLCSASHYLERGPGRRSIETDICAMIPRKLVAVSAVETWTRRPRSEST